MNAANWLRRMVPARFRPIGYLTHLTQKRPDRRVRSGPFAGMRYVSDSIGSAYIPKLLSIYERELVPAIDQACAANHKLIVDIGAAEGYYAVGLAQRNPEAKVIAFEMDERGRRAQQEMLCLNGLESRVEVRGRCEPEDLEAVLAGHEHALVVCDVEGYETRLLDPARVQALRDVSILVELHDFIEPGITECLMTRFTDTHVIDHIWQSPRSRADFPWRTLGTALLPNAYLDWAVSEWRPVRMAWLWMVPRTGHRSLSS